MINSKTIGIILVGAYILTIMTGYQNTIASDYPMLANISESITLEKPFSVERYSNSTVEPQDELQDLVF